MPTSLPMTRPTGGQPEMPDEVVDPELLALPPPPRRERTLTVLVLALSAIASIAMLFALRRDVAYALTTSPPVELGNLATLDAHISATGPTPKLVRARAVLGTSNAIRYERPLREGSFRLMPVAGRSDVWVELHVPQGGETSRYVPPSEFVGRWIRLDETGAQSRSLPAALRQVEGRDGPGGGWLLVDGDTPHAARWSIGVAMLFAGFAVWNLLSIGRILRRVG